MLLEMRHEASVGSTVAAGTTVKGPGPQAEMELDFDGSRRGGGTLGGWRTVCRRSEARRVSQELEGWRRRSTWFWGGQGCGTVLAEVRLTSRWPVTVF